MLKNLGGIYFEIPDVKLELPISNTQYKLYNPNYPLYSKSFETPSLPQIKPLSQIAKETLESHTRNLQKPTSTLKQTLTSAGISALSSSLSENLTKNAFGDSEVGQILGGVFSQGVSSAADTLTNNLIKGETLTKGLKQNVGTSLAGAGTGIASNLLGQGINAIGGDSMLSRGIGQGVATGAGIVGGSIVSNLINTGKVTGDLVKGTKLVGTASGKLTGLKSLAGQINPMGLAGSVVGTALSAAIGPSKEYVGTYGNITRGMDTAYDVISAGVNFIPGVGQGISGIMALNKGLSNIFGSTDGMTKTDAILGSAFMPAPIKWANVIGASKTGTFNNQSWQNNEKATTIMSGGGFGDLQAKFDRARNEAGKTYGTFSQGAKRRAQKNIDFANGAWTKVMDMADESELQQIRSQQMSSINGQRYAQMLSGGYRQAAIGKQGMKIFNNATNHKIGMRLLSGAALIDNKQMILCSAQD